MRPKKINALIGFWRAGKSYYLSFLMRWCARGEVPSKKHWCAGKGTCELEVLRTKNVLVE